MSERLAGELALIDEAMAIGDSTGAQHHRVLAEVYRSMLNSSLAASTT